MPEPINWGPFTVAGLGWIIALIVLIVVILLFILGRIPGLEAALFGALAFARLC